MIQTTKVTSLLCVECNARGTAVWNTDGGTPDDRHMGLLDLSRGFKFVDRGPRLGRYFVCTNCKRVAKEF